MKQFFIHASCHAMTVLTQFENFKHVNENAIDGIKIVTTYLSLDFGTDNCDFVL